MDQFMSFAAPTRCGLWLGVLDFTHAHMSLIEAARTLSDSARAHRFVFYSHSRSSTSQQKNLCLPVCAPPPAATPLQPAAAALLFSPAAAAPPSLQAAIAVRWCLSSACLAEACWQCLSAGATHTCTHRGRQSSVIAS
eukprot:scaffold631_cov21-Tisochrysis_lutea.AAC.2